jgi:lipid-binding SYLF domain-containing protein
VCDHVFLLMTDTAVELMFSNTGNVQLGADIGVAVGPLGRAVEADFGAAPGTFAPIYTYSMSKGLYAGISVDGKIIRVRDRVNEKFYGRSVSPMEFLLGQIPTPPAARPLYDALQRCHVYANGNSRHRPTQATPTSSAMNGDYGGHPVVMPPARNDAHSYAGMSDMSSSPGY